MKKIKIVLIIFLILCFIPIFINFYIIYSNKGNIYSSDKLNKEYDIALILGCSVLKNNEPSKMLRDRLDTGIDLYNSNMVNKILISGDHHEGYSEVEVMYKYLRKNNIPDKDIIIDKEGYSTSESIRNYKENYSDESIIIVTQKYHLYRALHISKKLDINAVGVHAKLVNYNGQFLREIREILARNKDFFYTINW